MFATVISQNKNSSSSLLLSNGLSPQPPPFFPPQTFHEMLFSSTTQRPSRLTSPTAGPLSFFPGPPLEHKQKTSKSGWVGPFNSQNPYEPTRTHHTTPGAKILWLWTLFCLKCCKIFSFNVRASSKNTRKNWKNTCDSHEKRIPHHPTPILLFFPSGFSSAEKLLYQVTTISGRQSLGSILSYCWWKKSCK